MHYYGNRLPLLITNPLFSYPEESRVKEINLKIKPTSTKQTAAGQGKN